MPELDDLLPRELRQAIESRMQRESPAVFEAEAAGFTSLVRAIGANLDAMQRRRDIREANILADVLVAQEQIADTDWRGKAVTFGLMSKEIDEAKARRDEAGEAVAQHGRYIEGKRREWQQRSHSSPTLS